MAQLMQGSSLLIGNNTIPGVLVPKEVKDRIPEILQACRDFGLDFYPTVVEFLTYDEISEIAAYDGFPVRYPHWKFGEQYEEMSRGYEHGYHRIYEMVVNCCVPGTHLMTDAGSKKIEDVRPGDVVFSRAGRRSVKFVTQQTSAPVVKINLRDFAESPTCTPHHRWMTFRHGEMIWVKAGDLQSGDLLVAGGRYGNFLGIPAKIAWNKEKVYEETASNVRWKLNDISPPTEMTSSLAELLGICTGDGSCVPPSAENQVSVSVDRKLPYYRDRVVDLFTEVFGRKPSVQTHRDSADVVMMSNKYVVKYLDAIGLKQGSTFDTKRVPESIWASSNEFRAAYLRGLFDTDGYMCPTLGINLKNRQLVADVQRLLIEMGIRSRFYHIDNKHNDTWALSIIGRPNIVAFWRYVGFSIKHKQEVLERTVAVGYSPRWGFKMPEVQSRIADAINALPTQNKLPSWVRQFRRRCRYITYGTSAMWQFVSRMINSGYDGFNEFLEILETPLYEVESVTDAGYSETWDVSLDHDDHDFLANGLVSHNTCPCYIYCLDSNTLCDHVTVIAHATGHNDYFRNNIHFEMTRPPIGDSKEVVTTHNMMNTLANHGSRIRRYRSEWGKDSVDRFIDKILSIETLIDPAKAWVKKKIKEPSFTRQKRQYQQPRRLKVENNYMEDWINTPEYLQYEDDRISREELAKSIGIFEEPEKDIFGFLKDHAPMSEWQRDVISMLYTEAMYFAPQRATKMGNEGWASYVDSQIMARFGFAEGGDIFDYAKHKAGVLGGKLSMNPYKLGYCLFLWIEECWNKGKFGRDYDECEDAYLRENWDKKLGLGHEKVFEVRQFYDDVTMLAEFFTQEFANKYEFFTWKKFPNGEYRIVDRDARNIKKMLIRSKLNGGLPEIKLADPNYKGKRIFLMEHTWDGRVLHPQMTRDTMKAISALWCGPTYLVTKNKDGQEIMYQCEDDKVEVVVPER